jgi:hypothetical protein
MAYLAVDIDGSEWIYDTKPVRSDRWKGSWRGGYHILLKDGDIEKLTGIKLTWNDEPIKYN